MRELIPGNKFKHFKGDIVTIITTATDSETLEEKVVYEHNDKIWVRDKEMFLSKVDKEKYPEVEQTYRFEEI